MDHPTKAATPDHPILDLLARRWSPYVFDPRPVEREKLLSCLEAARWAASSYNEQPWSFLVAERTQPNEFQKMLDCLVEGNRAWAKNAGVLLISVVCRVFERNGKPNRVAEHDIGLAAGNFTVQATALGLAVHQMAGIEISKTRTAYQIPDTHEPYTGIALGYAGDPDQAENDPLAQRDRNPRPRKPLSQFAFTTRWGQAFS
jgi:nitroreductase